MNRSGSTGQQGRGREEEANPFVTAGVVAAGTAAVLGGLYWLTRGGQKQETSHSQQTSKLPSNQPLPSNKLQLSNQQQPSNQKQLSNNHPSNTQQTRTAPKQTREAPASHAGELSSGSAASVSGYLADWLGRLSTPSSEERSPPRSGMAQPQGFGRNSPPADPVLTNLNALLSDIYVRYVQIKAKDFELHYRVFFQVFQHLHRQMKEVDAYYRKYSSTVQFAGSHYDNLRIKKPDEFDMDIIIDLPLNLNAHTTNPAESDIFIEPKAAGFAQLRMGVQFQKLPMRDGLEWLNNKAAYEWMDDTKYLLRSKFLDWFKGVVDRALNTFEFSGILPVYFVDGVPYAIRKSGSGPAVTLIIENKGRGFQLDVDLVPALKFPESRWPLGPAYRRIPPRCARGCWMLVGKPIKNGVPHDQARSWRLALHNQERELMHDSGNLRQALRLVKKVRDSLGMKKIASYYIKTIFFWEIIEKEKEPNFWQKNSPSYLFKHMVGKLHAALVNGKIPYFWNKSNNLVEGVDTRVLFEYAAKLVPLMQVLENPRDYKQVAKYLLTPEEFKDYNARFLHV